MSTFAGEEYFMEQLPDYVSERRSLVVKLILAFVFWAVIFPSLLIKEKTASPTTTTALETAESQRDNKGTSTTPTPSKKQAHQPGKKKKKPVTLAVIDTTNKTVSMTDVATPSTTTETGHVVQAIVNFLCCLCVVVHGIYLGLFTSPDNYFSSRTVFETPLFTVPECQHLVDMAERVASVNYQLVQNYSSVESYKHSNNVSSMLNSTMSGYLEAPFGWQKKRHLSYPTTDLNLVTDPFTKEDRSWIQTRLDARLAPTLQRIFGVPPSAIRANDIFLVRYDGDRQASLSRHTDDGSITFSALLSTGFEGGGTRYWNRRYRLLHQGAGEPFAYVLPKVGTMTTFPAVIEHEGVQTTKGRRYLLIGFLSVDHVDPFTRRSTGLSWFSSWGSLNWATVKFREGAKVAWRYYDDSLPHDSWMTSMEAGKFFQRAHEMLMKLGDRLYRHRFAVLVNETASEDFLHALDIDYQKVRNLDPSKRANWFSGQQIKVGFDGGFAFYSTTREISEEKFRQL